MNSIKMFDFDVNLNENYSWVDQHLREQYYNYALTKDNYDEFREAGLFEENSAWIDEHLFNQDYDYVSSEMVDDDQDEIQAISGKCNWVDEYECLQKMYKSDNDSLFANTSDRNSVSSSTSDNSSIRRRRAESDISDNEAEVLRAIERVNSNSPLFTCRNFNISPINTKNNYQKIVFEYDDDDYNFEYVDDIDSVVSSLGFEVCEDDIETVICRFNNNGDDNNSEYSL